jgi:large subunit ribosomal protein L17
MRHGVKTNRLNRPAGHRKALLSNLATSIILQGLKPEQMDRKIRTTVARAKTVRCLVDRLVTYAKKGDLSARREAARFIHDHAALKGLFEVLGPRYKERQGGYTRVLKLGSERAGDAAEMAFVELVEDTVQKRRAPSKAVIEKAAKNVDISEPANEAN